MAIYILYILCPKVTLIDARNSFRNIHLNTVLVTFTFMHEPIDRIRLYYIHILSIYD